MWAVSPRDEMNKPDISVWTDWLEQVSAMIARFVRSRVKVKYDFIESRLVVSQGLAMRSTRHDFVNSINTRVASTPFPAFISSMQFSSSGIPSQLKPK